MVIYCLLHRLQNSANHGQEWKDPQLCWKRKEECVHLSQTKTNINKLQDVPTQSIVSTRENHMRGTRKTI